ncbi:MAG TPA: amidase family protein [Xanthobacteraceae bacterium]|nr:amidase family protein [Xanthobacteraceae bacterium]
MIAKQLLADANELCRLGVAELAAGFASAKFTPLEVAQATLARAEAVQKRFNAFSLIDADSALAMASESTARWRSGAPLSAVDGVPTTIKDIVWVKDRAVRYGSRTTSSAPCAQDAPSVKRLRAAGAVFVGQTTTPEFGWKALTDSPLTGVTRNPWNPEMTPGGSSGGAVVAAATGAGVLHIGTDGGGSIRIPCSFTGMVGLKPTFGRVAAYPPSVFGTLAHIGPIARSAEDAAAMLDVLAGRDIDDWNQGIGALPALALTADVLKGARIGFYTEPAFGVVDAEVAAAVAKALGTLESLGARVEPVALPGEDLAETFRIHWYAAAANRFAAVPADLQSLCDPGFVEVARAGAAFAASALVAAQLRRTAFGAAMDKLLTKLDFIVSPATVFTAFAVGREDGGNVAVERSIKAGGFAFPFNLSQQPALSLPCGLTAAGLPIGLQFVGPRGADGKVLSAARDFARATGDGV